jgi:hypothetical protein
VQQISFVYRTVACISLKFQRGNCLTYQHHHWIWSIKCTQKCNWIHTKYFACNNNLLKKIQLQKILKEQLSHWQMTIYTTWCYYLEVCYQIFVKYEHCNTDLIFFFNLRIVRGGVQTGSTAAIYCPIVAAPGDCEDEELFGGMKIDRGNRSTRRKPAPAPLWPPQIPLGETRDWTRAAAVRSQRLTA